MREASTNAAPAQLFSPHGFTPQVRYTRLVALYEKPLIADEPKNLPLCAEPQRLSAPRPCAVCADQFRHGTGDGRALPAAHRGHRFDALPRRVRARDLRGPRLAWPCLGK